MNTSSKNGSRKKAVSILILILASLSLVASADAPQFVANPKQGSFSLADGVAQVTVGANFGFLDSAQSRRVLTELWGNPDSDDVLGMLIPSNVSLTSRESWAVVLTYSDDGHVSDDEAAKIDYSQLLKEMQETTQANNEERKEAGYPGITLVGWAEQPHYDQATHKLYWAKRLMFEGDPEETLNYCIRVLGRSGVLQLNVVASVSQLGEINKHVPELLAMVDFHDGQKYHNFDPKMDKVAVYGLGALIAGNVAAKAGLFKVILAAVLAMKKFLILALVALGGFVKKLLGRGTAGGPSSHSIEKPTSSQTLIPPGSGQ